ncbi:MAG TPA: pyridoxal-phosphate dependent enzyme, partial [Tepidisphaeraceae bacterium]|nr:pyridoxal-phosphate dependent enzyme [Tepidisphaeraceae bacterium]
MSETPVSLNSIRAARDRIRDAICRTPCPYSLLLSRLCGASVYCKLEHLQITGSFKERGARNKLMQLYPEQRQRGIIAASAGNHALALAYHGNLLHIPVTVVMPKWAPLVKITNCRSFGAQIVLFGEDYDDARRKATELAAEKNLAIISGFDDSEIIAGQG